MKALKYLAAFGSGFGASMAGCLIQGALPDGRQVLIAVGTGLLATGLFHLPSPSTGSS
jgi:hypothetical protein